MKTLITDGNYLYALDRNLHWDIILGPYPISIGKGGLTTQKIEGDLKTPIGSFALKKAFGFTDKPKFLKMPYTKIGKTTFCIDDPASCHYNTITTTLKSDWKSAEIMADYPIQYEYGLVIESNVGSCLFIHIWKEENHPTAGCIALAKEHMLQILKWIDKAKNPHLIVCDHPFEGE